MINSRQPQTGKCKENRILSGKYKDIIQCILKVREITHDNYKDDKDNRIVDNYNRVITGKESKQRK